jgi:hypothetical protein
MSICRVAIETENDSTVLLRSAARQPFHQAIAELERFVKPADSDAFVFAVRAQVRHAYERAADAEGFNTAARQ